MIFSWQQIPSPVVSEILCRGFDGVVLDTEHGCYSNETLYSCVQVIKGREKKCFVRLAEISKTMIRYCLDAGVDGIIFSTIETKEQCKKIIEYSCFPPAGKRGLGLVRQNFWGEEKLVCDSPILIPQIETKTAIDNLEEIVCFDFDYYLIGPYDLSLSLNVAEEFNNEKFLCYIGKVCEKIPERQMAIHLPKNIDEQIEKYKNYGLRCLGMDTTALIDFHKRTLQESKSV